jgi:hypothetical protein
MRALVPDGEPFVAEVKEQNRFAINKNTDGFTGPMIGNPHFRPFIHGWVS